MGECLRFGIKSVSQTASAWVKRSKARVPFTSWCCNIVIGNGSRVMIMGVLTHEKNSGETVRRLGTIIQSIFCAQSGAGIRLNFWKWFGESRYPGALSPVLENFRRAFSPDPTDCPWVSEDARYAARWAEYLCISVQGPLASFHLVFHGKVEDVFLDVYLQNSNHHRHLHPILARCCHKRT